MTNLRFGGDKRGLARGVGATEPPRSGDSKRRASACGSNFAFKRRVQTTSNRDIFTIASRDA